MTDRAALLAEAYRRGLLPPDQKQAYEEATRRGLLGEQKKTIGQEVTGFMANVNRGMGFGDELVGALGTAGDVIGGKVKSWGGLGKSFDNRMAQQRGIEDDFAQRRPNTAALAQGTGAASTMILPSVAGQAAMVSAAPQGAGLAARAINAGQNAARVGTAAGASGAVYGAMDRGTLGERLTASSQGAENGFKMGALAGPILGAVETRRQTMPTVNPRQAKVDALIAEDVRLTPGQAKGGVYKALEDAGTSLPFVGPAIAERRTEGLADLGRANLNRSLRHIGEKLPEDVAGYDAIAAAEEVFGRRYKGVVPKGGVTADEGLSAATTEIAPLVQTLTEKNRERLQGILDSRVMGRLREGSGTLDGPTYQRVQSDLGFEINRFKGSQDPDHNSMAEALKEFSSALKDTAARQNPEFADELNRIDRGYAEFKRAQAATASPGARDGIYTADQYNAAVRAGDKSKDKASYARGDALGQEFGKAAREVLPSQIPDSGSAGRGMVGMLANAPGAALGAAVGGAPGALAGLAGTGAMLGAGRAAYSPAAMTAYNKALREGVSAREQMKAAAELRQLASQDPAVMELYRDVVSRIPRAIGATAGR